MCKVPSLQDSGRALVGIYTHAIGGRYGEFEDMVAILDAGVVPVDYQNDGLNTVSSV